MFSFPPQAELLRGRLYLGRVGVFGRHGLELFAIEFDCSRLDDASVHIVEIPPLIHVDCQQPFVLLGHFGELGKGAGLLLTIWNWKPEHPVHFGDLIYRQGKRGFHDRLLLFQPIFVDLLQGINCFYRFDKKTFIDKEGGLY